MLKMSVYQWSVGCIYIIVWGTSSRSRLTRFFLPAWDTDYIDDLVMDMRYSSHYEDNIFLTYPL
jgi:hypothetical protein